MTKKYILLFLLCLASVNMPAQSLSQAKALYEKGEYEKARPIFKDLVKAHPSSGNYNLWYGVCCLKTGKSSEALNYLETAVKKRVPTGQLYLAQTYDDLYRFEDGVECYESYINELSKRHKSTEEVEQLLEKSKTHLRMLKGIEKVCIVDSFVVDKKQFLSAYKISSESGKLFMYNDFFENKTEEEATVYKTELGNKIYYGERQPDGKFSILTCNKMQGEWSEGKLLPGTINEGINANYPYMSTDGITIYYAADGENSMGGYDIFVTRYNTTSDSYLTPENVGMPFNSPYNDYMYVIDGFNNLGWFASDRYQPDGKVCIYVFIPNTSKEVYNYEAIGQQKAIQLAQIHSLKETWFDKSAVADAKIRLQNAYKEKSEARPIYDFDFIINDDITYHQLSDFKSPQAKALFSKYRQTDKELKQQQRKLMNQRIRYANMNETEKSKLSPAILDLEKRVEQLSEEVSRTAIEVRNNEIKNLK